MADNIKASGIIERTSQAFEVEESAAAKVKYAKAQGARKWVPEMGSPKWGLLCGMSLLHVSLAHRAAWHFRACPPAYNCEASTSASVRPVCRRTAPITMAATQANGKKGKARVRQGSVDHTSNPSFETENTDDDEETTSQPVTGFSRQLLAKSPEEADDRDERDTVWREIFMMLEDPESGPVANAIGMLIMAMIFVSSVRFAIGLSQSSLRFPFEHRLTKRG